MATKKKAALNAVRSLTGVEMSSEHASAFMEEVRREKNDRGAAILAVTNTENALRYVIARRLAVARADSNSLFGIDGPMGTFGRKIRMGRALKIYGEETNDNLIILQTIRNAFAHAHRPITFETAEIKSLCEFLVNPFVLFPKSVKVIDGKVVDPDEPIEPRARFSAICESLTHNFLTFGVHCSQIATADERWPQHDAWLTPKPLS
jgi:hypothetical protein